MAGRLCQHLPLASECDPSRGQAPTTTESRKRSRRTSALGGTPGPRVVDVTYAELDGEVAFRSFALIVTPTRVAYPMWAAQDRDDRAEHLGQQLEGLALDDLALGAAPLASGSEHDMIDLLRAEADRRGGALVNPLTAPARPTPSARRNRPSRPRRDASPGSSR